MNQAGNRRNQETVRRIRNAMLQLLEEKQFAKITVQDICGLAEINRSTFYRHYIDLYDLMQKIEEEIQSGFVREWKNAEIAQDPAAVSEVALARVLSYIFEHRTFYRVYLRESVDTRRIIAGESALDGYLKAMFENYGVLSRSHMEYYYTYAAAGFAAIVARWIGQEAPEPADEIAGVLYRVMKIRRESPRNR